MYNHGQEGRSGAGSGPCAVDSATDYGWIGDPLSLTLDKPMEEMSHLSI